MKKKHILYLKRSRLTYIIEYACGILLLSVLAIGILKGIHFKPMSYYLLGGISFFAFASAEFNRFLTRYRIFDDKIVIVSGIIKQNKKNVYFHPLGYVTDINIHQSRLNRFMGLGTVYIKQGGDQEYALEIKDVTNPQKIMKLIEDLIEQNRNASHSEAGFLNVK